jgi:hypothetical protein
MSLLAPTSTHCPGILPPRARRRSKYAKENWQATEEIRSWVCADLRGFPSLAGQLPRNANASKSAHSVLLIKRLTPQKRKGKARGKPFGAWPASSASKNCCRTYRATRATRRRGRYRGRRRGEQGVGRCRLGGTLPSDRHPHGYPYAQARRAEATRRILAPKDTARILILTTFDLDEYVYEALRAGASGFVLKGDPPEQLLTAIDVVARGEALLSPSSTKRVIKQFTRMPRPESPPQLDQLTGRELEVFRLIARAHRMRRSARALHY